VTLRTKLDLNLLRVAAALLEAGSVSRAAKVLGLSQPSVSESLAKLRSHFDDALFVRYLERIPVIAIDGVETFELDFDHDEARAALAAKVLP
jgi:hypothetical protein